MTSLHETLVQVAAACREPFLKLTDSAERIYWLYLISSLVLAWWVVACRPATRTRARPLAQLFDRRVWNHLSAWLDYKLMFAKALLGLVTVPLWGVSTLALAVTVVGSLDAVGGTQRLDLPRPAIIVAYSFILFVAWDLSRYLLHRVMHEVRWLWAFHQVHHSAQVLTPFTLYRSHPVEAGLFWLRGVLVTAAVSGTFFHLFGSTAIQLEILGVNAIGFVFNAAGGNLRHSHVWLSFGPRVERLLLSPAQHQLHHSMRPCHQCCNYGTWLAIWDRLGRSLVLAEAGPPRRFGLARGDANHHPHRLTSALIQPPLDAARSVARHFARWHKLAGLALGMLASSTVTAAALPPADASIPQRGEQGGASKTGPSKWIEQDDRG